MANVFLIHLTPGWPGAIPFRTAPRPLRKKNRSVRIAGVSPPSNDKAGKGWKTNAFRDR